MFGSKEFYIESHFKRNYYYIVWKKIPKNQRKAGFKPIQRVWVQGVGGVVSKLKSTHSTTGQLHPLYDVRWTAKRMVMGQTLIGNFYYSNGLKRHKP